VERGEEGLPFVALRPVRLACCGQRPQAGLIVKEQSADAPDVTYDVTTPTSPRLAVLPDEFL
jgi:hypothetical protein